jgi:hypothetical protein
MSLKANSTPFGHWALGELGRSRPAGEWGVCVCVNKPPGRGCVLKPPQPLNSNSKTGGGGGLSYYKSLLGLAALVRSP